MTKKRNSHASHTRPANRTFKSTFRKHFLSYYTRELSSSESFHFTTHSSSRSSIFSVQEVNLRKVRGSPRKDQIVQEKVKTTQTTAVHDMASVPTWQACQTAGLQCVLAVWAESYHEILGVFVLSFVFFVWLIKPPAPRPERSRARRGRTRPAGQETRRVQRPHDATQTPAHGERRAPPVVESGAAASHAPTTRVGDLERTPSGPKRLHRPPLNSKTGRPAEAPGLTRVSPQSQTKVSPRSQTREATKVSPRSKTREATWQSGTRFYSNVVARLQQERRASFGGAEPSGPAEAPVLTRKVSSAEAPVLTRKVSPRSQTREATWQSGTRFYSKVVARQQEEHRAAFGGAEPSAFLSL